MVVVPTVSRVDRALYQILACPVTVTVTVLLLFTMTLSYSRREKDVPPAIHFCVFIFVSMGSSKAKTPKCPILFFRRLKGGFSCSTSYRSHSESVWIGCRNLAPLATDFNKYDNVIVPPAVQCHNNIFA